MTSPNPSRTRLMVTAAVVGASAVLAGCGGASTALTSTTTTTQPAVTTTTHGVTTTTVPAVVQETLFFTRGDVLGVSHRSVTSPADPRLVTMQALLGGPIAPESAAGLSSAIPAGTALRGLDVKSGVATVNFSPQFVLPGPAAVLSARLAQVVYTLTNFPNVSQVSFQIGRFPLLNFAGVNLANPVGRSQVTAALPPVLLVSPAVGDSVHGTVVASGITSVVGTWALSVSDAQGHLLTTVTNTAVPGGTFSQTIPISVTSTQTGTLTMFAKPTSASVPAQTFTFPLQIGPAPGS